MDRRSQKPAANPRTTRTRHRSKNHGHVLQLLLLLSVVALLLGSVVAWRVYSHRGKWREWSMSMRSGMLGMRSGRADGASDEELGEELRDKSIQFLGAGYAELGEFSIGRYDAVTNTTLTVNFKLKGMTPCEDEETFNRFMHENQRAFRDRVTEAVRDCRLSDYADTNSMSRKVAARVNRAFNGRFLESAELAEFDVFESVGTYQAQDWQTAAEAAAEK